MVPEAGPGRSIATALETVLAIGPQAERSGLSESPWERVQNMHKLGREVVSGEDAGTTGRLGAHLGLPGRGE